MKPQDEVIQSKAQSKLFPRLVKVQVPIAIIASILTIILAFQIPSLIRRKALLESQIAGLESQVPRLESQIAEKQKELDGLVGAINERNKRDTEKNPKAEVIPIVYIQFKGGLKREIVQELRAMLNEQGFPAPGVERVDGNYDSNVRYFYEEDKKFAEAVSQNARSFFEGKGCSEDFPITNFASSQSKAKRGQIEIWISMNCHP